MTKKIQMIHLGMHQCQLRTGDWVPVALGICLTTLWFSKSVLVFSVLKPQDYIILVSLTSFQVQLWTNFAFVYYWLLNYYYHFVLKSKLFHICPTYAFESILEWWSSPIILSFVLFVANHTYSAYYIYFTVYLAMSCYDKCY